MAARSSERFLTTHTGSLPRPDDLIRMMYAKEEGVPVDREALGARVRSAVAEAMRAEYESVAQAGFVLQLDCPDLAMGRHIQFHDADLATFRKTAAMNIEVMNHATANIPAEQLRMHVCWGNYEGPHHH